MQSVHSEQLYARESLKLGYLVHQAVQACCVFAELKCYDHIGLGVDGRILSYGPHAVAVSGYD